MVMTLGGIKSYTVYFGQSALPFIAQQVYRPISWFMVLSQNFLLISLKQHSLHPYQAEAHLTLLTL
jgi:hypothetical protein